MKRSTSRILTTHTGSLPRPPDLVQALVDLDDGKPVDATMLATRVKSAVAEAVRHQADVGVDVVCDGEMGKMVYATYVKERLTGFEGETQPFFRQSPENIDFPEFAERRFAPSGTRPLFKRPACNGPISLKNNQDVRTDIANLKAGLQGVKVEDVFMSAASPGVVGVFLANEYYPTYEE